MTTTTQTAARKNPFQHEHTVTALEAMAEPVEVRRTQAPGTFSPCTLETMGKKTNKLSTFEVELLSAWSQH